MTEIFKVMVLVLVVAYQNHIRYVCEGHGVLSTHHALYTYIWF